MSLYVPQGNKCLVHENDEKILIGLNSGLIDCLDFDELCFVIGHELGHAFYEHPDLYGICQSINIGSSKLPEIDVVEQTVRDISR